MLQNVKLRSGLIVAKLNLADIKADDDTGAYEVAAIVLPNEAEIIGVSLEVVEAGDGALTADIGFNDEAQFFSKGIALSAVANFASSKQTTLNSAGLLKVKLSAAATKGVIKVRAHFFYPSEQKTEIAIVEGDA